MTYNAEAQKVAVKAIGTVETGMKYDSIRYAEACVVGLMQWTGPRGHAILARMRTENPSAWNVAPSIEADMAAHPNDSWWARRFFTRDEGATLRPVLIANKAIQDDQAIKDFDDYVEIAEAWGMDKDANTQSLIFFMSMYHQSPKRAKEVINTVGPKASLERFYAGALNNSVLGRYRTRQKTVYDIVKAMDSSGVDDPPTPSLPDDDPDSEGNEESGTNDVDRLQGDVGYLELSGDSIAVHMKSGSIVFARPTGTGRWIIGVDGEEGAAMPPDDSGDSNADSDTPPDTDTDPGESSGDMPADKREKALKVIAWTKARIGRYRYSQNPGRLEPDKNGFTDCSGLLYNAYLRTLGIEVGTWTGGVKYTGGMRSVGKTVVPLSSGRVDESKLWLGDLFIMHHKNGVGHVEMYIGDGKIIGHGGVPYMGPTIKNLQEVAVRQKDWLFKRHL